MVVAFAPKAAIRRNRGLEVTLHLRMTINIIPPTLLYAVARIVPPHQPLEAPLSERFRGRKCDGPGSLDSFRGGIS
jgi:hypothetical protein